MNLPPPVVPSAEEPMERGRTAISNPNELWQSDCNFDEY